MNYRYKFTIALIFCMGLLYFLSNPVTCLQLPPLATFMNPFTGFWTLAENDQDYKDQKIINSDIIENVDISFDQRMVPHIYAQSDADAFYAMGYLHAKNRLFQMDITQRAISGELAALVGEAGLSKDIFARRINFNLAVDSKVKSWKNHPDMMVFLNAYTKGVNQWIGQLTPKNLPIEYKLLDAKPRLWSIEKTAAIAVSLAATLNLNLRDFGNSDALAALGDSTFQKLFPLYPQSYRPIISKQWPTLPVVSTGDKSLPTTKPAAKPTFLQKIDRESEHIGSNNWAINSSLTENGHPLLANDPHLPLNLPSIWYEIEIHSPNIHSHGVSIPGTAGIIIGFNNNIAWGLTNAAIDVLDSYTIHWEDSAALTYRLDNEILQAQVRKETIEIKNQAPHIEEVIETYWGPILYGDSKNNHGNIAVKWVSYLENEHCDLRTFYHLMKAKNYNDYKIALQSFYIPGQNIVFADIHDSIALTVQGKFPIKTSYQGRFVQDGSNTLGDWKGYIPDSLLPRQVNPQNQYLISANEWPTDPSYPFPYTGYFNQYRGRTIEQLILQSQPINPSKMAAIQNSVHNLKAAESLPNMLKELKKQGRQHPLIDSLTSWDFDYNANSSLPTLTEMWLKELSRLTFDELEDIGSASKPSTWRLNELIQQQPNDIIFDLINSPQKRETASDIILISWDNTLADYTHLKFKKWGQKEGLSISHILKIPAFSHLNLNTGGNGYTIQAITKTNGPSWKMIVELDPSSTSAQVVYPGGQSGNPGSPYYDNFIDTWLTNDYYSVQLTSSIEDLHSIHTIQMVKQ